ncbi:hypothetical protein J1N35_005305, partial [Gossypium stocksii]
MHLETQEKIEYGFNSNQCRNSPSINLITVPLSFGRILPISLGLFVGSIEMDCKGKEGPPTSGADNLDLSTEALTGLVREVLKEVFEARVKELGETLQTRCLDCKKKREHNSLKLESHYLKC